METIKVKDELFLNKQINKIQSYILKHKIPIITAFIVALISHMFAFTNKLVNCDDILHLFTKGTTVTSGRWGLELTSFLFPDFSMPWIYGILSTLFITFAICLIIDIFKIKNEIFKALLSGLIVSFPSLTGIFAYMFTSASFSLSFFLSVLSVYLMTSGKKINYLFAVVVLVFSVSIYQSYIAIAASLSVIFILKKLVSTDEDLLDIFKKALNFVLILGVSLAIYYGINILVLNVMDTELNLYAVNGLTKSKGILYNLFCAYLNFFLAFIGRFNIWVNPINQVTNCILFVTAGLVVLSLIFKKRNPLRKVLSLVVLFLFPLSVCCIYLFVNTTSIHTLVMYSLISVYVFIFVFLELITKEKLKNIFYNIAPIMLVLCIIDNVYIANNSYLQLKLGYENAYSYYSSVMTSVTNTPGFDSESKLALCVTNGTIEQKYDLKKHFDSDLIMGVSSDITNTHPKYEFINYYLGYDVTFASHEEIAEIMKTDEYKEMPTYPYYGSIKEMDGFIVVKLN